MSPRGVPVWLSWWWTAVAPRGGTHTALSWRLVSRVAMLKTIAPSLAGLVRSVEAWVATGNEHRRRFIWHKSADQILDNLTGYLNRLSNSGH